MSHFQGKNIVITGGSDGIGKALVQQFLGFGAKVATCGRNTEKLKALELECASEYLMIFKADVSKKEDCDAFIQAAIQQLGGIDVLINNAGISMRSMFDIVPFVFLFFIPAITMRSFSEEKKQGTIELLLTKPVTDTELVMGKFLISK